MKELKYFNQLNDYTSNKDSFEYPTVSYVEENTNVYYVNPPASFINLHYEIKDESQLQMINSFISSFWNKLPLLMRSDLIQEAKLNGQDITSQLHQGEPHVFTATTASDKSYELQSLVMNESGITDYAIAVDGPFSVGNSWDLQIKFKDGITDCIGLFYSSMALSEIPENLFSNNTAVTTFECTFANCVGLTSIPENLFSNNTKVTSFGGTFGRCYGLTSLPDNLFSNCTAVTDFIETFYYCHSLTSIPNNLFSNNTAVTNFGDTFRNCSGLTGNVPVDNDGTPIYNRSGEGKANYAIVTRYTDCFYNCTGLTDYSSIPTDWKYAIPN